MGEHFLKSKSQIQIKLYLYSAKTIKLSPYTKFGFDTSKHCWDMTSCHVCRFGESKSQQIKFMRLGQNWTKFVACKLFFRDLDQIQYGRNRRHGVYWTRLDPRNTMEHHFWKTGIRFKVTCIKSTSKFDLLVALERSRCWHQTWWNESWDGTSISVPNFKTFYQTVLWAAILQGQKKKEDEV